MGSIEDEFSASQGINSDGDKLTSIIPKNSTSDGVSFNIADNVRVTDSRPMFRCTMILQQREMKHPITECNEAKL